MVYYCSRDCQAKHWKAGHKTHCTNVKGALNMKRQADEAKQAQIERIHSANPELTQREIQTRVDRALRMNPINNVPFTVRLKMSELLVSLCSNQQTQEYARLKDPTIPHPSANSVGQAIYEYLIQVIEGIRNPVHEQDGFRCFQAIPDLLLRLGQDQLAFDMITWNVSQVTRSKALENGLIDDAQAFEQLALNEECSLPPFVACFDANRQLTLDSTQPLGYRHNYGNDISSSAIVEDIVPMILPDLIPIHHILCLAMMKAHLLQHWNNLDAFYTFILCCDQKNTILIPPISKLGGKLDIFRCIREYLFDEKNFLPSTRVAIKDHNTIVQQIKSLLHGMTQKARKVVDILFRSDSKPVFEIDGYNVLLPTCLFHDPATKKMLCNIYKQL